MQIRIIICLVLGLTALQLNAQDDAAVEAAKKQEVWEETVSYAGRFQVSAPGYMVEKTDTLETKLGQQVNHTFFYQSPDKKSDNLFYMVSYVDYPEGTMHMDSVDLLGEFFEASAEEAAFSITGDLVYSNPRDWNGYPGQVWRVDYLKGQAIIKTRAFLVENRYYTIQTIMLRDNSLNPSTQKFFDSFYLLDGDASGN
ncbi:hypothetical protein [Flavilitoribacter nigricans]|uniref:hypothetical protein n=1 Tax=Flavilitoribacter nigricans TaxID=70997 RepID=UPI00117AFB51|nr:hypothetical protein [Flavilitoribacter nigricans]